MFTKKDLSKLWEVGAVAVIKSLEKIESVSNQLSDEVSKQIQSILVLCISYVPLL